MPKGAVTLAVRTVVRSVGIFDASWPVL